MKTPKSGSCLEEACGFAARYAERLCLSGADLFLSASGLCLDACGRGGASLEFKACVDGKAKPFRTSGGRAARNLPSLQERETE
jgi:hypothetical protein